jgi:hypothetical protein
MSAAPVLAPTPSELSFSIPIPGATPKSVANANKTKPRLGLKTTLLGDTDSATTLGWDTVFAVPVQYVNAAIAASHSSPTSFSQSNSQLQASITGTFGTWQIALGGSGEIMAMSIPISSATMTYSGTDYPLSNLTATVLVELQYVQQTAAAGSYNLVLNPAPTSSPAVVVETIEPQNSNSLLQVFLQALLGEWLNANVASFAYIFNTVNLDAQASNGDWQWMMPTTVGYSFAADPGGSLDNSVFGVLCMTQHHAAPTAAISPGVIPSGAQAGFVVDPGQYMENLLIPMLPDLFTGSSASDFSYSDGVVTNTASLNMQAISVGGSDKATDIPVGGLTIEISGSEIVVTTTNAHFEYSPGIDVYLNYTAWFQLQLVTKSDGTHTFSFVDSTVAGHTSPSYTPPQIKTAVWVTVTEVIVGIIAAGVGVAVGAAGPFATTAMNIALGVVLAMVITAVAAIPQYIEIAAEQKWDEMPSVDDMLTNITNTVSWPGGTVFTVTSAQFNDSLQLGGSLSFA